MTNWTPVTSLVPDAEASRTAEEPLRVAPLEGTRTAVAQRLVGDGHGDRGAGRRLPQVVGGHALDRVGAVGHVGGVPGAQPPVRRVADGADHLVGHRAPAHLVAHRGDADRARAPTASSQMSPLTVAPFDGSPTLVVGGGGA